MPRRQLRFLNPTRTVRQLVSSLGGGTVALFLLAATANPAAALSQDVASWDLSDPVDYLVSSPDATFDNGMAQLRQLGFDPTSATSIGIDGDGGQSTTPIAGDVDGDGDLDIYVAQSDGPNRLWINDGTGNFTAKDIAGDLGRSYGAAFADIDGDGDLDIHVQNYSNTHPDRIWENDGSGNFVAKDFDLSILPSNAGTFGDIDGDGDLDLYVSTWTGDNRLYINDGTGSFTQSNIPGDNLATYGSAMADIDADGDLDLYVTSPGKPNRLWINDGLGNGGDSFTESSIVGDNGNSTWAQIGDIDGDGDLDIHTTNHVANHRGDLPRGQNYLWINDGLGNGGDSFTAKHIPGDVFSSFGSAMTDIDLDGDLDLYVTNLSGGEPNRLWINDGFGNFVANDIPGDMAATVRSVIADLNNDGTPDIYAGVWGGDNPLWVSEPHPATSPYVVPKEPVAFEFGLTGFTETLGEAKAGSVAYQVSTDGGTTWKFWDGSAWVPTSATDGSETSPATDIDANITTLDDDGGDFLWRAYLVSEGTQQIQLDQVGVSFVVPDPPAPVEETDTEEAGGSDEADGANDEEDRDGIPAAVEAAAPNGDGNGDGIPDAEQSSVASLPNPATGAHVTVEVVGSCVITRMESQTGSSLVVADAHHRYPLGLFDFDLTCGQPGQQATVKVYYDAVYHFESPEIRSFLLGRFGAVGGDVELSTEMVGGAEVTVLTYTLADGGRNDVDGIANGVISNQAGLAVPVDILALTGLSSTWLPMVGLVTVAAGLSLVAFGNRRRSPHRVTGRLPIM